MSKLTDDQIEKLLPKSVKADAEKRRREDNVTELNDEQLNDFLERVSPEQYTSDFKNRSENNFVGV